MIFKNVTEYIKNTFSDYKENKKIKDDTYDIFLYDYNMNMYKKHMTFYGYLED